MSAEDVVDLSNEFLWIVCSGERFASHWLAQRSMEPIEVHLNEISSTPMDPFWWTSFASHRVFRRCHGPDTAIGSSPLPFICLSLAMSEWETIRWKRFIFLSAIFCGHFSCAHCANCGYSSFTCAHNDNGELAIIKLGFMPTAQPSQHPHTLPQCDVPYIYELARILNHSNESFLFSPSTKRNTFSPEFTERIAGRIYEPFYVMEHFILFYYEMKHFTMFLPVLCAQVKSMRNMLNAHAAPFCSPVVHLLCIVSATAIYQPSQRALSCAARPLEKLVCEYD